MDASETKQDEKADLEQKDTPTEKAKIQTANVSSKSNGSKNEDLTKTKKSKLPSKKKKEKRKEKENVPSSSDDSDSSRKLSSSDSSNSSSFNDSSDSTSSTNSSVSDDSSSPSDLSESSDDSSCKSKRTTRKTKRLRKARTTKSKFKDHSNKDSDASNIDCKKKSLKLSENSDQKTNLIDLQKELLKLLIQDQKQRNQIPARVQSCPQSEGNTNFSSMDAVQLATSICNSTVTDVKKKKRNKKKKKETSKSVPKPEYKRIDEWYDSENYMYRTTDSDQREDLSKYDESSFNVRRHFNMDGKYQLTMIDVKSKLLKEELSKVMKDVKSICFTTKTCSIKPNLLFLYLEDIQNHYKDLKHVKLSGKKKKNKSSKRNSLKLQHLKVLTGYLNTDFATVKKTLYPMMKSGVITFEYLWGLYKPGTIVCTPTFGNRDDLRAFKVETAEKMLDSNMREFYLVQGKYLECDGKACGMANIDAVVDSFNGAQKITELECYPLNYHQNPEELKKNLTERGKKFVGLDGVHQKYYDGLAFSHQENEIVRINVKGRIMIDPILYCRYNPDIHNTLVSIKDNKDVPEPNVSDLEEIGKCSAETSHIKGSQLPEIEKKLQMTANQSLKKHCDVAGYKRNNQTPEFNEEQYLVASPLLRGFSFADKTWLEFSVSNIQEVTWNDDAYDSLVLDDSTKSIIKALVQSHKNHPAKNIDDIIRGKGKGLVTVLHGPPGTGKTLTAESIAELLRYPLYTISAGELGHETGRFEFELQRALDMASAWGAVLLLDEADVFLEKRSLSEIHRNGLVSIFLRLLEYYQGIIFLTTNRVQTFDEAFQSRIHVAIRYEDLSIKARRTVFKIFLERASSLEDAKVVPFSDEHLNNLSKYKLNGRQIKNIVRTALALAVQNEESLCMSHVQVVLDMYKAFEQDLKGGPGFEDAMRCYS